MATIPITISLQQGGAQQVQSALSAVAQSASRLGNAFQTTAKQSASSAQQMASAYKPLANAWSPAIAAAKQYEEAQKSALGTARRAALDAANAFRKAASDEKDAARDALNAKRQAAQDAANAYRRAAQQSLSAQRDADRAATASARQAARDIAAAQKQGVTTGTLGRLNVIGNQYSANKDKFSGAEGLLGDARKFGLGAMAIGGVGSTALFKSSVNAGEVSRIRNSFRLSLGDAGGDQLFKQLEDFDRKSPFSYMETMGQAQSALAQDFKASEIIPLFTTLGDAVSKAGGGTEEFARSMAQISQIRSKGTASMQDIRALAEGGKLPIVPIIKSIFGDERAKSVLSGDEPLKADEFFGQVMPELQRRSKGAMAGAMEQLPGQLETLNSALFKLSATVGKQLLPVVTGTVRLLTKAADAFGALPDPLQKAVVWGGAFVFAVTGIVGALVTAGATIGLAKIGLLALTGTEGIGGLATAATTAAPLLGGLTGALSGVGGVITASLLPALGLIAPAVVAAAATVAAVKWTKEAATKSDEEMMNGSLRQRRVAQAGAFLGGLFGRAHTAKGNEAEAKSAEIFAAMRKKSPYNPALAQAAAPKTESVGGMVQLGNAGAAAAVGPLGSTSGGSTSGYDSRIEALEDRIAAETDKEQKKALRDDLRLLRRARKHAAASERADKKAETEERKRERERAKAERELLRSVGLSATGNTALANAVRDERIAELQSGGELSDFRDKRAMAREIRGVRGKIKSGDMDSEAGQQRIQAIQDAYAARDRARDADAAMQIAELRAQQELAEGAAKAAGEKGDQRTLALKIAQASAQRIRSRARAEADLLREEGADLQESAREGLQATTKTGIRKNILAELAAKRLQGSFDRTPLQAGGRMFGMRSGDYGDGLSAFASIGSFGGRSQMAAQFNPSSTFSNRPPKARGTVSNRPDGKIEISFEKIIIDRDDGLMAAAQVVR